MVKESLAPIQIIELFHLAFLLVLQARLRQEHYVLKGGANLRYFFDSSRYSEDIDLDAIEIEPWKLAERVNGILMSPALAAILRSGSLSLEGPREAKQTDTTQRWKAGIRATGRRTTIRTKIEFSHRPADSRRILEAVPDQVVAPYALRAPTMLHYTAEAAIEQKVKALAYRSETQARDVFDLELLLRQHRGAVDLGKIGRKVVTQAVGHALELPFAAFRDQVSPFLHPDVVELYEDPAAWEQIREFVADRLMELQ